MTSVELFFLRKAPYNRSVSRTLSEAIPNNRRPSLAKGKSELERLCETTMNMKNAGKRTHAKTFESPTPERKARWRWGTPRLHHSVLGPQPPPLRFCYNSITTTHWQVLETNTFSVLQRLRSFPSRIFHLISHCHLFQPLC